MFIIKISYLLSAAYSIPSNWSLTCKFMKILQIDLIIEGMFAKFASCIMIRSGLKLQDKPFLIAESNSNMIIILIPKWTIVFWPNFQLISLTKFMLFHLSFKVSKKWHLALFRLLFISKNKIIQEWYRKWLMKLIISSKLYLISLTLIIIL